MVAALLIEVLAFWPVWRWYALRIRESPEEAWALAALATGLYFLVSGPVRKGTLAIPAASLTLYAAVYVFISPVFRAALASLVLGATVWTFRVPPRGRAGVFALLLMATPAMASFEFVAGFPLRVLAARLSALLISASGFAVTAQGAMLQVGERFVDVDAPCSGVRTLWAALYLAFTISSSEGLTARQTVRAAAASVSAVIGANTLRASSLFFLETGWIKLPAAAHTATGIAAFVLTTIAVVVVCRRKEWCLR